MGKKSEGAAAETKIRRQPDRELVALGAIEKALGELNQDQVERSLDWVAKRHGLFVGRALELESSVVARGRVVDLGEGDPLPESFDPQNR